MNAEPGPNASAPMSATRPDPCPCQERLNALEPFVVAGTSLKGEFIEVLVEALKCASTSRCPDRARISDRARSMLMALVKPD